MHPTPASAPRFRDDRRVLDGKSVLVTGGTGSFGRAFVEAALRDHRPRKVIVYSRDELKQSEMAKQFPDTKHDAIRFFLGDVRDADRLRRAMKDVDYVVHAAALKQVPACEYNPIEAVKTNIHGAENIIEAALDAGVERVLALSTDKAVNPANLYGATKQVAERLFVHGNSYSGAEGTRFACTRYGNVLGSRGSVLPLFLEQRKTGRVTITDPRMTRFWITLDEGVRFVVRSLGQMQGGEVFVPKIPSMQLLELVKAVAPDCDVQKIGIRAGEKLHEVLLSEDEARETVDIGDAFVVQSPHASTAGKRLGGKPVAEGFRYTSDGNDQWLRAEDLRGLLEAGA